MKSQIACLVSLCSGIFTASVAQATPPPASSAQSVKVLELDVPAGLAYDGDQIKVTDATRYRSLGKIEATFIDPAHETNTSEDVEARKAKILANLRKQVMKKHDNLLVITSWFRRGDIDPVTNKERESFDKVGAEGMAIVDNNAPTTKMAAAGASGGN